jgi:hypothetical protein
MHSILLKSQLYYNTQAPKLIETYSHIIREHTIRQKSS